MTEAGLAELSIAQAKEIEQLKTCLHELLHWIYPRDGDPHPRTETFITEALIGFHLLGEDHPFENVATELEIAQSMAQQY
jgi:hypothetical protein